MTRKNMAPGDAWSSEWPTEEGWYWFYGDYNPKGRQPMLRPMEARRASNAMMYIGWGTFLYPHEFESAQFLPLTPPAIPGSE